MPPASTRSRHALACSAWAACLTLAHAGSAFAERATRREPPRYVSTLAVGAPLRLTRNADFNQGAFAPWYGDVLGGYVLSSAARVRHGVGLGLSVNLSDDGGFTEPVPAGNQLVVMPTYLVYWEASATVLGLGHFGIPIVASGGRSAGVEVALGAGYRFLAGFGAYAEGAFDAFAGAASTLHATFAVELGVFLDYEVLP